MTARTPVQRQQSLAARKRAAGLREVRSLWLPLEQHKVIRAMAADPTLAALRKDAERYRWLRDSNRIPREADPDGHIVVCPGGGEDVYWGRQLDAAIDAAMAAEVKA